MADRSIRMNVLKQRISKFMTAITCVPEVPYRFVLAIIICIVIPLTWTIQCIHFVFKICLLVFASYCIYALILDGVDMNAQFTQIEHVLFQKRYTRKISEIFRKWNKKWAPLFEYKMYKFMHNKSQIEKFQYLIKDTENSICSYIYDFFFTNLKY